MGYECGNATLMLSMGSGRVGTGETKYLGIVSKPCFLEAKDGQHSLSSYVPHVNTLLSVSSSQLIYIVTNNPYTRYGRWLTYHNSIQITAFKTLIFPGKLLASLSGRWVKSRQV